MDLRLQLYVRAHRTGFFTVQLVGDESLVVYAETLEDALEDLELTISDRVERTHPRFQSTFSAPLVFRHEVLEVDELVPVFDGARGFAPGKLSVLLAESRAWRTLWLPRLDLHYFLPAKGADWAEAARELVTEHLEDLSDHRRLELRMGRDATLRTLELQVRPPPLSAFSGDRRTLRELPLRAEEEEREEAKAEAEAEAKAETKKVPTPTLDNLGVALSRSAEEGELGRAVARDAEVEELVRLLRRRKESCVAVVGPSGVGKSALLDELVHRLRDEALPESLRKRPVWFVDASRLIAGDGFFGDWQRQTFDVIEECESASAIWYVGSILPLLDAGKHAHSELNVSQLLKPFLAGGRLTLIGEATDREWAQLEARDAGFARLFTPYRLAEPDGPQARRILDGVADSVADEEGVRATPQAIDAVQQLCRRYAEGSQLGAAARLLRRAVEGVVAAGQTALDRPAVIAHFSSETGLPQDLLRDDVPLDTAAVEQAFRRRLIGQGDAVRRMGDLVAVIKAGMSDLGRPLGGFLFVGPTGVGKTEMAKGLASYLFGDEDRLLRFDMSEYVGGDAIHRFLGHGEQEGKLVHAIRKQPFSVVLLDEIEKADPAIFDVLLQVLGEARLTDEAGRTADFKNAVVILTSNLGVDSFRGAMGIEAESAEGAYRQHFLKEAERFFRPEFFNRLDHIVAFRPLEAEAIERITEREVDKLMVREGLRARGVSLRVGADVRAWLAARGVDPRYGARPLKRVLERSLAMPLARYLGRFAQARTVEVRVDGERLAFERLDVAGDEATDRTLEALTGLLATLDELRFRLSRWMRSRPYLDMDHGLTLLDQLSRTKHFWADRTRAEARTKSMARQVELRDAFVGLKSTLAGLEDVALEAFHDRDVVPVAMVTEEIEALKPKLRDVEMRLFASRFEAPDRVRLYLRTSFLERNWLERLLRIYGELALASDWQIRVSVAKEILPDDAEAAEADGAKKARRRSRRFEWSHGKLMLSPQPDLSPDARETEARRFAEEVLSGRGSEAEFFSLEVRGPYARAWLAFESGVHVEQGQDRREVRVEVTDFGRSILHPNDVPWTHRTCRTFSSHRNALQDHLLGTSARVNVRGQLAAAYRRFMRSSLYVTVFGPEGVAWAKRWGRDD